MLDFFTTVKTSPTKASSSSSVPLKKAKVIADDEEDDELQFDGEVKKEKQTTNWNTPSIQTENLAQSSKMEISPKKNVEVIVKSDGKENKLKSPEKEKPISESDESEEEEEEEMEEEEEEEMEEEEEEEEEKEEKAKFIGKSVVVSKKKKASQTVTESKKKEVTSGLLPDFYNPIENVGWKAGEPVPYSELVALFSRIEKTKKRHEIQEEASKFFRQVIALTPSDLLPSVYLCLNSVAPAFAGIEMGVGDSILIKAIMEATGRSKSRFVL